MDPYANIIEKAVNNNIPFFVHFDPTYKCNLRCIHCYIKGKEEKELSLDEIKDILDQLAEAGSLFLVLSGGEPLLRNDFFDIARYARERGFAVSLLTNGTLITKDIADQIQALHLLRVEMSIYGASSATHDSITRVPGSYDKLITAIKLLKERDVNTLIKCMVMKENMDEIAGMKNLAIELGADFVSNSIISPGENGDRSPLRHALSYSELCKYLEANISECKLKEVRPDAPICGAGRSAVAISAYGDVYPCVLLKISAGNLRKQSFRKIWTSADIFARVRSIFLRDLKECTECEYNAYCYQCIARSFLERGSFFSLSTETCKRAKAATAVVRGKGLGISVENTKTPKCLSP